MPPRQSWLQFSSPRDQPKAEKPIAKRVRPAGSVLGDFRTPDGARNPSRWRTVRFQGRGPEKCGFTKCPPSVLGYLQRARNKRINAHTTLPQSTGVITRGDAAFAAAHAASALPVNKALILQGLTMRVGMAAEPTHPGALATSEFMNRIAASNPQYTGWPAWLDARGFYRQEDRARVEDGAWVTYIHGGDMGERERIEYMLYDPRGDFYTRRLMQDDTADKVKPFTLLDPLLMLYRVTEFIAAGISIVRGAGWNEDEKAGFAFSWTGLNGRQIRSWVNPLRFFGVGEGYQSHTDAANSYVEVGLDTPHLALAPAVERAVAPLLRASTATSRRFR